MLKKRLEEITKVMEASSDYTPTEINMWRLLTEHVDMAHFDRTGQILTDPLVIEDLYHEQSLEISNPDLENAINALVERGHLALVEKRDVTEAPINGVRYRLFLKAADYGGS